ncbi:MAG: helix-turn-helix domain-containing protein [Acidobacteria bacterium]|nr:helix-turn-helix domain-containing protein [Acidobacteriota bacterium]
MEYRAALGEVLRAYREEAQLSQRALADRAVLARSYVIHIEQGERLPSFKTLARIADVLGVRMGEVLDRVDRDHPTALSAFLAALHD